MAFSASRLSSRFVVLATLAAAFLGGCSKLQYSPDSTPIKFSGIQSLASTKEGTYVITWSNPDQTSAPVDRYEIMIQEVQGLALQDSATVGSGVLIDMDDAQSPATLGKVFGSVKETTTYTITGLLPGNYAIQVKAVGSDGKQDGNTKVLLLTVDTKIKFNGLESAELIDKEIVLSWSPFVTTLKGDPIYYVVYLGETFSEKETLALVTAGEDGVVPTTYKLAADKNAPGTILSFGVRVKDPLGQFDQNVAIRRVQIPEDNTVYEGCVNGKALGSAKIELEFDFPKGASQVNVYRNGAKVLEAKSAEHPIFTDIGLQEGQEYEYSCEAVVLGVAKMGTKKIKVTTLNSNPPTFSGITSVNVTAADVTAAWGVATGVPTSYYAIFATAGNAVDWGGGSLTTTDESHQSITLNGFGDELPYSFGVRSCTSNNICDENTVSLKATLADSGPPKTVGATAAEVKNSKMVITAPWKPADGAVAKRRVYVYLGTANADNFSSYVLKKTVAVDDLLNPPTSLELDSLTEGTVYNIVVRDEDPSGNVSTNFNKVTRNSGDLNAPDFTGLTTLALGADGKKETTLLASFVAAPKESVDPTGASFYQVYLKVGGGNACESGVLQTEFPPPAACEGGLNCDYVVKDLTPRTIYGVCIKARDAAGNISQTDSFLVKSTIDTTPPVFDGIQQLTYDPDTGILNAGWNESSSADTLEYVVKVWKNTATPTDAEILTMSKAHPTYKSGFALDKTQFSFGSNDKVYVHANACDTGAQIPQGQKNCTTFPLTSALNVTLADIDPPPNFAGIAASGQQSSPAEGNIAVSWIAPADWTDYRGFRVYAVNPTNQALELLKICACSAISCPEQMTSCSLTGLNPFRTYNLHVRAYDAAGNLTLLDPLTKSTEVRAADTTPPSFSSNLAVEFNAGGTDLSWTAATDNQYSQEPGAVISYLLYRKTGSGFGNAMSPQTDGELLGTLTAPVHRDTKDYQSGVRYYYTVCATDGTGNRSCDGNVKNILTPDLIKPTIDSFTTTKTEDDKIWALNWVFSDNSDANGALLVTVRRTYSPAPETPDSSVSPIAAGYGLSTLANLKGPANQDVYVNYLLTIEDSSGNVETATLSVFSQNLMTITSVKASSGPTTGGNIMVIYGTGFHSSTGVSIGPNQCTGVQKISKEILTCYAPAGMAGKRTVTVANSAVTADGSSAELIEAYEYCTDGNCPNVCGNPSTWLTNFAKGVGNSSDPFVICTPLHLKNLNNFGHGTYALFGDNIDLSSYSNNDFPPIKTHVNGYAYVIVDGGGYVVANYTYQAPPGVDYAGLFGRMTTGYYIQNLGVVNVDVSGANYVGGLVGLADSSTSTFQKVFVTGKVTGTGDYVGGIAGYMNSKLFDSYGDVEVTARSHAGALAGQKYQIQSNVTGKGTVHVTGVANGDCMAGGLFGRFDPPQQTIDKMTYSGDVTCNIGTSHYTGGLWGYGGNVTLTNASFKGKVTGGRYTGGIGGACTSTIIEDSTVDAEVVSLEYYTGGVCGTSVAAIRRVTSTGKVQAGGTTVGGLAGDLPAGSIIEFSSSTASVSGTNSVGGLAGMVNSTSIVRDSFAKGTVSGNSSVGGAFGRTHNATVQRVYANGKVTGAASYVGGLVGEINYLANVIENSYATGDVTGNSYVGGFAGYCRAGVGSSIKKGYSTGKVKGGSVVGGFCGGVYAHMDGPGNKISESYTTSDVEATSDQVGGFIGRLESHGTTDHFLISGNRAHGTVKGIGSVGGFVGYIYYQWVKLNQNFATGAVQGDTYVGGFVGYNNWGYYSILEDNYALGNVIGSDYVGGFGGYSADVIRRSFSTGRVQGLAHTGAFLGGVRTDPTHGFAGVPNSYFDKDNSGVTTSPSGGVGKTNAEMKVQATFVSFDFANVWKMPDAGGFPLLKWE